MPKFVYMNLEVLESLDKRQFSSGMAEIIKHGLIRDPLFFQWILSNVKNILKRDKKTIEEMIYQSCLIKKDVVERDPKEKGERALLNFGHTIGHAIEKLSDFRLLHGECVSIGMTAACWISSELGSISKEECSRVTETFRQFGLPVSTQHLSETDIFHVTKSDKKMDAGKIKFILLKEIGNAYIDSNLEESQIRNGISFILNDTESRREEE